MALQRLRTSEDKAFGTLVANLFASTTVAHVIHLNITGEGSYARHKALQKYYEAVPDTIDLIVEQYQGHHGKLLDIAPIAPPTIKTVEEFVNHLNSLYIIIDEAHKATMCTSLKNVLDEAKGLINTTKYKLKFLS
jgi:DNA-binding ferritin-like protein